MPTTMLNNNALHQRPTNYKEVVKIKKLLIQIFFLVIRLVKGMCKLEMHIPLCYSGFRRFL